VWGMIARITTLHGKRDQMISILSESTASLPGCLSYIVAKDLSDEDVLWINEVWDNQASHDESLSLPQVQNAIPRAKPLVADFQKIATLEPVWGVGLASKSTGRLG
jgi:quinol monooxygenase YgiN